MQQGLLPKICGKAQGLSSQRQGGLHIYSLLLLEQFTERGSCMQQLSADHSESEPGISQSCLRTLLQLQSKFNGCLYHRRGGGGTAANKNCILEHYQWLVIGWRESSPTMMATCKQCIMWYFNLATFIDPWCITASSTPMQISGFLLF